MSNVNDDSQKKLVAEVVKYHLRATDEQVKYLMTLWGLESLDDLPLLSEKEILGHQIPIIHFRRAVDNQWKIPPHLEFSNIIISFTKKDSNEVVDYEFRNTVTARYITFKPSGGHKFIRCDVFVDHSLQDTPQNQRKISSFMYSNSKDSTLQKYTGDDVGWLAKDHGDPKNEWLQLDLQSIKNITGIRMMKDRRAYGSQGHCSGPYEQQFALEFCNSL